MIDAHRAGFGSGGFQKWQDHEMNPLKIDLLRFPAVRTSLASLGLIVGMIVHAAPPVLGHHAGYFDDKTVVRVSGVVARFEWTNPHSFLYLDIETPAGTIERWTIEGRSPNQLRRGGWSPATITPGAMVTVEGSPPRDTSRLAGSSAHFLGAGRVELDTGEMLRFGPHVPED
jgi:hypothetical protein